MGGTEGATTDGQNGPKGKGRLFRGVSTALDARRLQVSGQAPATPPLSVHDLGEPSPPLPPKLTDDDLMRSALGSANMTMTLEEARAMLQHADRLVGTPDDKGSAPGTPAPPPQGAKEEDGSEGDGKKGTTALLERFDRVEMESMRLKVVLMDKYFENEKTAHKYAVEKLEKVVARLTSHVREVSSPYTSPFGSVRCTMWW